jgi:FkbM family methyltransferase
MRKTFQKHTFSFEYLKENLGDSTFLLPLYALRRPAAHSIIVKKEFFEPETHRLIGLIFEKLSGSMIHAGTFFGDMLPSFSRSVSGVIWCFEPVVENYILANKCIEENKLGNVFLVNAALSDKVEMVRINTVANNGEHRGGSSFLDNNGKLTPSITIDNFQYDSLTCNST